MLPGPEIGGESEFNIAYHLHKKISIICSGDILSELSYKFSKCFIHIMCNFLTCTLHDLFSKTNVIVHSFVL